MRDLARRQVLTGGLALCSVVLLGGCDADPGASPTTSPTGDGEPGAGDMDILATAARLERDASAAYTTLLADRVADLAAIGLDARASLWLQHHEEHARSLDLLTGTVDPPASLPGFVVPSESDLAELPAAQLAVSLRRMEVVLAATYRDAVARLSEPNLRQVAAGLAAAEAAHAATYDVVLNGVAAYDPTTSPDGRYPLDRSAFQG